MDKKQRLESYVNHLLIKEVLAINSNNPDKKVTELIADKLLKDVDEKEITSDELFYEFCLAAGSSGLFSYQSKETKELNTKIKETYTELKELEERKDTLTPKTVPLRLQKVVGSWFFINNIKLWKFFFKNKLEANLTFLWYKLIGLLHISSTKIPENAIAYVHVHMLQFGFNPTVKGEDKQFLRLKKSKNCKVTQLKLTLSYHEKTLSQLRAEVLKDLGLRTIIKHELVKRKVNILKEKIKKLE